MLPSPLCVTTANNSVASWLNRVRFFRIPQRAFGCLSFVEQQEKSTVEQHEQDYQKQLDEKQTNLELALAQYQTAQVQLAELQEEKQSNEKLLNSMMQSMQEDSEQQLNALQTQKTELEKRRAYAKLIRLLFPAFLL